jgi:O-antigen/teichoic acid export membrane protein
MQFNTIISRKWRGLFSKYFLGQGAAQLIQLASGFLLIRWLDKGDYATYTLVMAILGTSSVLFSLGLSQCLTGLIGKRVNDANVVGRYIKASKSLRNPLLAVGSIILFALFYSISEKFEWGGGLWCVLWLFVVSSLFFKMWEQVYSPILLLNQQIGRLYLLGLAGGSSRLLLILGTYLLSLFSVPVVLLYNVAQAALSSVGTYVMARSRVVVPLASESCARERSEILKLSLPKIPTSIFAAFSSQLIVFLVSILGTQGQLAEIGALTRLAMLFVVFKRFGSVMVTPYFAKLDFSVVPARLRMLLLAMGTLLLSVSLVTYVWPDPLLFLLGNDYGHLGFEVFLVVVLALTRVCNVQIVSVRNARNYIFNWHSIAILVPQLCAIITGALIFDLGVLSNVLYFSLLISVTALTSNLAILWVGLQRERRQT